MGVCFLGWPNRIDDATLTGGSWDADLPLANLKTRQITKVARTADDATASTKFLADLGEARSLLAFALVNHNLSSAAQWRVLLGTTSGASDVYAGSWVNAWRLTFDTDMLEWGDSGWWEGTTDDDAIGAPFAAIHVMAGFLTARYVTIEISDTSNPDTYVQIGRVFIGGGYWPTVNASHDGYSENWEDLSAITAADSGTEFYDERRRGRVVRFTLPYVSHADAATLYEMQRRLGTTGEVLWIPDVADAEAQQRYGFLGRLRQLSAIEYPWISARRAAFEIKEIL
jgi:hypothetical protein